jgi:hypothetical protein
MLRRLRRSSPARAMLCLAVLLATAAAFGLHPEPLDEGHAAAFSAVESVRSGAHLCVACLTHAPALTAALAIAPQALQISEALAAPVRHLSPPRLSRTPCSGLSPPALS